MPGTVLSPWCIITCDIEVIAHLTHEETVKSVANHLQKTSDHYIFRLLLILISLPA